MSASPRQLSSSATAASSASVQLHRGLALAAVVEVGARPQGELLARQRDVAPAEQRGEALLRARARAQRRSPRARQLARGRPSRPRRPARRAVADARRRARGRGRRRRAAGRRPTTRWARDGAVEHGQRVRHDRRPSARRPPLEPGLGGAALVQRRGVDHGGARDVDRRPAPARWPPRRGGGRRAAACGAARRSRRSRRSRARRRPRSGARRSARDRARGAPRTPTARSGTPLVRIAAGGATRPCARRTRGWASGVEREARRRAAHGRVVDLAEPVDQLDPLLGLEDRVDLLGAASSCCRRAGGSRRGCGRRGRPARACCRCPWNFISEMIWCGFIVPCSVSSRWIVSSVIEPGPWWPRIGMPLTAAMSTARAGRVLGDVARGRQVASGRT